MLTEKEFDDVIHCIDVKIKSCTGVAKFYKSKLSSDKYSDIMNNEYNKIAQEYKDKRKALMKIRTKLENMKKALTETAISDKSNK